MQYDENLECVAEIFDHTPELAAEEEFQLLRDQWDELGDIANPHHYYAEATSRFRINDITTVVDATNEEYRIFMRRQEELVRKENEEKDPDKKRVIELGRKIEGADYLVVTSERLAVWSTYATGKGKQPEGEIYREIRDLQFEDGIAPKTPAEEHMARANSWREYADQWRDERSDLIQVVREREMADFNQQLKEAVHAPTPGKEQTDAKAEQTDAQRERHAVWDRYGVSDEQRARFEANNAAGEESEAAIEASRGRSGGNSR